MDSILKALGFESKPGYADKIPEKLVSEDFHVHKVRNAWCLLLNEFTVVIQTLYDRIITIQV